MRIVVDFVKPALEVLMRNKHVGINLLVLGAIRLQTVDAIAASEFFALGDLAGGVFNSQALSVDDSGSTVVGNSAATTLTGFIWNQGPGMIAIADPSLLVARAESVSGNGQVVVGGAETTTDVGEPFRWSSVGGFEFFGRSPGTTVIGRALDASIDGNAIVGSFDDGLLLVEAFYWTSSTGIVALGVLPGGDYSEALAVSRDGEVAVGHSGSTSGQQAYRWTNESGMLGLGDLPGGKFRSVAWDISNDGEVIVGESASASQSQEAFRWTLVSGMVGLGLLPGTESRSEALAVDGSGNVVVGVSGLLGVKELAFVWDPLNGMRSLHEVLADSFGLGSQLAAWQLTTAHDISDDGLSIVGTGINPDGNTEAWLVRLDRPLTAPEPNSLALMFLAIGLWGFVCRVRKRADRI